MDALWRDFEYDLLVNERLQFPAASSGIHSTNTRKAEACVNFRLLMEDPNRKLELNDRPSRF